MAMRYAAVLLLLAGCDLSRFAANSTGSIFARASPALDEHWDVDLAGEALPSSLMQMEGLLQVVPENEEVLLNAIRGYVSYGYGWVEDRAEVLRAAGDTQAAEREVKRAILVYERGATLAKHYMALRHDGFDDARRDTQAFRRWLRNVDDADDLWWVGYAWGQHINARYPNSPHPDRAFAISMVRRSVELDPTVYGAAGSAFLAYVATRAPGSTVEGAERAWTLALERAERRNLLMQVIMARTYAVRIRDRELYLTLLREVLTAGDVAPELRLSNRIAKRRARRYVREVDTLFP
ncbi:MAG: TRAP transporter TatT component family protein [Myxococcota bacterium]